MKDNKTKTIWLHPKIEFNTSPKPRGLKRFWKNLQNMIKTKNDKHN